MQCTKTDSVEMKNILISTLGSSWQIIPETIGAFVYDEKNDFYGMSGTSVIEFRDKAKLVLNGKGIDELWLLSTDQKGLDDIDPEKPKESLSLKGMLKQIVKWRDAYGPAKNLIIRVWVLHDVSDIESKVQVTLFHNMALHVLYNARLKADGGKLLVSLACGRKTMSADIQDAAYCFGCDMMMHVLAGNTRVELNDKKLWLNEEEAKSVFPIELNPFPSSDLFEEWLRDGTIKEEYGRLLDDVVQTGYDGGINACYAYYDSSKVSFLKKVQEKREAAKHFYSSYWSDQQYSYDNFPILYTLSRSTQESLKNFKVGLNSDFRENELALLRGLPKADLHCHLGGVLSPKEIIEVASAIEDDVALERSRNKAFREWNLNGPEKSESWKDWRKRLSADLGVSPLLVVAAYVLQFKKAPERLDEIIYGPLYNKGVDLRDERQFVSIAPWVTEKKRDLTPYEALGDLQGSGLLKHEKTLRKTLQIFFANALLNNQKYVEIRCSPINYGDKALAFEPKDVVRVILEEMQYAEDDFGIRSSMIFIASRHGKQKDIKDAIKLYQDLEKDDTCSADFKKFFRGFDVAGNESEKSPEELRMVFQQILQDCKNVTVHAGETMPAENIWEAVYCLNAERIGHGLTLEDRENDLMPKFRDRRIGIEMCPSSNYQIVGFKDNYYADQGLPEYPLRKYMENKLRVCINTDDPGMSRTDMTNELLKAARLTRGGLSLWEIFGLLYNSFDLAFLPYDKKIKLLNDMNLQVKNWLDVNVLKIESGTIYEK